MSLEEKYDNLPEWLRWILCWPISIIIPVIIGIIYYYTGYYIVGAFKLILDITYPPLVHSIFLIILFRTIQRGKILFLIFFTILRLILSTMALINPEDGYLNIEWIKDTISEVIVLISSIVIIVTLRREIKSKIKIGPS